MGQHVKKIDYATYILGDQEMKIVDCNDEFIKLTGYSKEEALKLSQRDLIPLDDREEYFDLVARELEKKNEAFIEHTLLTKDGGNIYVFCLGHLNSDGSSTIRVIRMDETLALQKKEREITKCLDKIDDLEHDELTHLLRRKAFLKEVKNLLSKENAFTFVLIDIDDFKNINDTYGHTIGDEVLVRISDVFRNIDKDKYVCRMGGDEFALTLNQIDTKEKAKEEIEEVVHKVSSIKICDGLNIGLSIGAMVINPEKSRVFDDIYYETDKLLYKSKNEGKNRYTIR